ncbi:ArsR/SmtB family transcription factor [Camelliibacillus cellulosilyticus]|uniref:ArsR/SmtB family transcription factor n=1 Tax=Camelliibacillus cellulosilyticus TaxID=2174486 RepID=A0ABV9GKC5_9BACL
MDDDENLFKITAEQQKLISNATRIKLLHLLKDEPRTAKQAADLIKKSPGSVHYHIKLLYEGGLLDLVKTEINGGVLEKYYQAKTTAFQTNENLPVEGKLVGHIGTHLLLSNESRKQLMKELNELLSRWERYNDPNPANEKEMAVTCLLHEVGNDDQNEGDES